MGGGGERIERGIDVKDKRREGVKRGEGQGEGGVERV